MDWQVFEPLPNIDNLQVEYIPDHILFENIKQIEMRYVHSGKTVMLIIGIGAAIGAAAGPNLAAFREIGFSI